jgi:hypothetical protein
MAPRAKRTALHNMRYSIPRSTTTTHRARLSSRIAQVYGHEVFQEHISSFHLPHSCRVAILVFVCLKFLLGIPIPILDCYPLRAVAKPSRPSCSKLVPRKSTKLNMLARSTILRIRRAALLARVQQPQQHAAVINRLTIAALQWPRVQEHLLL